MSASTPIDVRRKIDELDRAIREAVATGTVVEVMKARFSELVSAHSFSPQLHY
jgi:hypothetical protein